MSVACNDNAIGVGNFKPCDNKEENVLIDLKLASNSEYRVKRLSTLIIIINFILKVAIIHLLRFSIIFRL